MSKKRKSSIFNQENQNEIPPSAFVKIPKIDEIAVFLLNNLTNQATEYENTLSSVIVDGQEDLNSPTKNERGNSVVIPQTNGPNALGGSTAEKGVIVENVPHATASLVMCVHWAVASSIDGDTVVRYDKEAQVIICEFLIAGVQSRIKIAEKEIDTVTISGNAGEVPISDPASSLPCCIHCKSYFGTISHLKAHTEKCALNPDLYDDKDKMPTIIPTEAEPQKNPKEGFVFHIALTSPPVFEEQTQLIQTESGNIKWKWQTVSDFTHYELSAALQLSIFFRPGDSEALFNELKGITNRIFERKKRAIKRSLSKKNGIIPEGTTFLKYFPGHGYFRGAVGRKVGRLYRIVYADQDKEDLEEKGILRQVGLET